MFVVQCVEEEGGMEHITRERKWSKVASKLGFPAQKGQGTAIRTHYERILYPYFLFKKGKTLPTEVSAVVLFSLKYIIFCVCALCLKSSNCDETPVAVSHKIPTVSDALFPHFVANQKTADGFGGRER
jgi:hypothetical protein